MKVLEGTRAPVKVWVDDLASIEAEAVGQLRSTADLPWVEQVAVMPDVHFGKGATVGSVILCRDAVSPAVVGVDIGCGMCAVKTPYREGNLKNLAELRHSIERSVPVGFNANTEVTPRVAGALAALGPASARAEPFAHRAAHQLGTLGGGNHFIEVCLDEQGTVWVMLHSGSRHIGKSLAEVHIQKAKGLMADLVTRFGREFDPELAALAAGTPEYMAYLEDLDWCQRYAHANRREMMARVLKDLSFHVHGEDRGAAALTEFYVECHHNYIEFAEWGGRPALITRKGAVSAKAGEFGIIPGSMGTRSFIVRGLGNEESLCSCSHGAGRRMSRGKAKRSFTEADLLAQTAGVECRKDVGVLDEIPGAYKDIDVVIAAQSDLVEVHATLKQVLCVKG